MLHQKGIQLHVGRLHSGELGRSGLGRHRNLGALKGSIGKRLVKSRFVSIARGQCQFLGVGAIQQKILSTLAASALIAALFACNRSSLGA